MLLNLSEKLERKLENCKIKLNSAQLERLAQTLEFHDKGLLPANVLKRELEISNEEIHQLMTYLSTQKILIPKYKIYCENDMATGASKVYDDISELPMTVCDRCDNTCILIERLFVEFEVCIDNV